MSVSETAGHAGQGATTNEVKSSTAHNVAQADSIGNVHFYGVPDAHVQDNVPRQLLAPPRLFSGRAQELTNLSDALEGADHHGSTMGISAIVGAGGIGKTYLALHWAHQNIARFPDGQLYVNLRGFDPSGQPMSAAVAVRGFLDALGADPAAIPIDVDAQGALYRSMVAGKKILILLDNARDASHVTPLLPGSPTCTVLVTSRHPLAGLAAVHGACLVGLDVLSDAESQQLLSGHLGDTRMAAESKAVAELLRFCAGLPLALSIVAARAHRHGNFPLTAFVEELRDESLRLKALDAGDLDANLKAVLSHSYRALDAEAIGMFGLLGIAAGPDIGLSALASLGALTLTRAQSILRELEDVSLVQQYSPGRFRMHDLVRVYAAEQACEDLSLETQKAALRRLVDFYLFTAHVGEQALYPSHKPLFEVGPTASGCASVMLKDEAASYVWFETEHPCVLAAQHEAARQGWHREAWQLAWTLNAFHRRRGHARHELDVWRTALASAEQWGDPAARVWAHRFLAHACGRTGKHDEAAGQMDQALALAETILDDSIVQGQISLILRHARASRSADRRLLCYSNGALYLSQAIRDPLGEADSLSAMGWFSACMGNLSQARTLCEAALPLFHEHGDPVGEAQTLDSLGYVAHRSGQHADALSYYGHALALRRDVGDFYGQAVTLNHLGDFYASTSHYLQAYDVWQRAIDLYYAQHNIADANGVKRKLVALSDDTSDTRS